jgi:GR25 family glycosyltransferase involved in LPS biosynthesis
MYIPGSFMCLSFHLKNHLKIGKGGMILTDDEKAANWFKRARYEGRSEKLYHEDDIDMLGWNMYMTPQQAAHGLALMQNYPKHVDDLDENNGYRDLTEFSVFKNCKTVSTTKLDLKQSNKICFVLDTHYKNYTDRLKKTSLKSFIDMKLYEQNIDFLISTNLPNEFSEYKSEHIKVFDIEDLRKEYPISQTYEKLPESPYGLYPGKFPWNIERFILKKAGELGYNYVINLDSDVIIHENFNAESLKKELDRIYTENTLMTNQAIFQYERGSNFEVFNQHDSYKKHFDLNYEDTMFNSPDGPVLLYMGKTNQDIINFANKWNELTEFGYKKEFGFGYDSVVCGNWSLTTPMVGFKLKWNELPFIPHHVYEDRYPQTEPDSKKIELVENNNTEKSLESISMKYHSDKISHGYIPIYDKYFKPLSDKKINIMEIGVANGDSLKIWNDYFESSNIVGVDIVDKSEYQTNNIQTIIADQESDSDLKKLPKDMDIIIDDGGHEMIQQQRSLVNLFCNNLKNGGLYVIEDIQTSDKSFQQSCGHTWGGNENNNTLKLLRDLKKGALSEDSEYFMTMHEFSQLKKNIEYLEIYEITWGSIMAVIKKIEKNNSVVTEHKTESEIQNITTRPLKIQSEKFSIKGVELADQGYFINLEKSTDRNEIMMGQIEKLDVKGLNRFEALTDPFIQYSCTKSHLEVFRQVLETDLDSIVIFEDDAKILEEPYILKEKFDLTSLLKELKSDMDNVEWDVILLGCNPKSFLIPVTNTLSKVHKSTGGWAYIIKKRAFEYIFKNSNYRRDLIAIDDWLPKLSESGFNVFASTPLIVHHGVGLVSTLQPGGPVNYTTWIDDNYYQFLYARKENKTMNDLVVSDKFISDTTIVIPGYFCENFLFYLKYLLKSLPEELYKCKFMIIYDNYFGTKNPHDLIHYFLNRRLPLNYEIVYSNTGVAESMKIALEKIKTKYMIWLEHDAIFLQKNMIDFNKLHNVFENYNFVNLVWFNTDDNQMRGFDLSVDKNGSETPYGIEERITELDLVKTTKWSNRPMMLRVSKMKEWYDKYIDNPSIGVVHQGQSNIEESMIKEYKRIISENVWSDIKDDWGTFYYGKIGEGPYCGHTDASRRFQDSLKTMAEDNANLYIQNNPLTEND